MPNILVWLLFFRVVNILIYLHLLLNNSVVIFNKINKTQPLLTWQVVFGVYGGEHRYQFRLAIRSGLMCSPNNTGRLVVISTHIAEVRISERKCYRNDTQSKNDEIQAEKRSVKTK